MTTKKRTPKVSLRQARKRVADIDRQIELLRKLRKPWARRVRYLQNEKE